MRYQIDIIQKYCKCCGICQYTCPRNVYDFSEGIYPVPARAADCIGCRQCEYKCPDFAIIVKEEKDA